MKLIEHVKQFFSPINYDAVLKLKKTNDFFSRNTNKNRPTELLSSFNAILNQTRLPDQIIIVDQSLPKCSRENQIRGKKSQPYCQLYSRSSN